MNEEPGATRRMDPSEVPASDPAPASNADAGTGAAAGNTQEFQLTGDSVIATLKELVHEGSVRRIVVKHADGHVLVEFPLTAGVVGALLLPMWAALGAIVALVADLTIVVERRE